MTICFQCKHLIKKERQSRIWHELGCKRRLRKKEMCPVTGDMVPDGNGVTIKNDTYACCRDVNNGACPLYEAK